MQMSVSRRCKPPGCRRYSARYETATPSLFPFSVRYPTGERERARASNIRFKLSNWISAPEALGSSPKFAKRVRNANRDSEDRDWAERIRLFERSLDFQSRSIDLRQYNSALHVYLRCPFICTHTISMNRYSFNRILYVSKRN